MITAGAGGSADITSRRIAEHLTDSLGQRVIVENKPGSVIPGETVAKAPPDGYTLLLSGNVLWVGPLLEKTPFDPVRDFAPITTATISPNVLVVHPSLPVSSVKELIAYAKARPGELNYSMTSPGSANHLSAELFKSMAGVNIVRIAYKTGAAQWPDLLSGQVHLSFGNTAQAAPFVKTGKLKALGVTSAGPSVLVPGVPTVASSGLPGYESLSTLAMFAPAKTPSEIIRTLNQEVVRVLQKPDVREYFLKAQLEVVGDTPEQLAESIKQEMARIGKVIKEANIRVE